MNASTPVTAELPQVLQDITQERVRQIEKGWTPEHDDRHVTHEMVNLAQRRARLAGAGGDGYYSRERLVEAATILVATIEAWDRREARR